MKTKLNWFDRIMMAITFAESGEEAPTYLFNQPQKTNADQHRKTVREQQANRPRQSL